jgi:hypothetical protein
MSTPIHSARAANPLCHWPLKSGGRCPEEGKCELANGLRYCAGHYQAVVRLRVWLRGFMLRRDDEKLCDVIAFPASPSGHGPAA